MAELSSLFISIGSKFDSAGIDKAIASIEQTNSKIKNISEGFTTAGIALTAFATAGVVLFTKLLKNTVDSEKATYELAAAMKQAGTYTEAAYKHNLEYATSLMKVSNYTDEEINSVQRMLTFYGIQGPMLDKLTQATLDLAAAKGLDLNTAAGLLGRTIDTETNAMARQGVIVEGTAGSIRRMESAVQSISDLFGGAAKAQSETWAGRIQQLKIRWDEFLETVGKYLLPTLDSLLKTGNEVIAWLENLDPGLVKLIVNAGLIAVAIAAILGPLMLFIGQAGNAVIAIYKIARAIQALIPLLLSTGIVGAAIAAAAAIYGLVLAIESWQDASIKNQEVQNAAQKTLQGKIDFYKQENAALIEKNKNGKLDEEQTKKATETITKNNTAIKLLTDQLNKKTAAAEANRNKEHKLTEQEIKDQMEIYKTTVELTGKNKKEQDKVLRNFEKFVRDHYIAAETGSKMEMELLKAYHDIEILMAENRNVTILGGYQNFVANLLITTTNWQTTFQAVFDATTAAVSDGFFNMYKTGVDTWDKLAAGISQIGWAIRDAMVRILSDMVAQWLVKMAVLKAAEVGRGLLTIAVNLAEALAASAKWLIATLGPFALFAIPAAAASINSLFNDIKKGIPGLAEGGLLMGPKLAMIGEAGPEIALPLNNPRAIDALSQAINKTETNIGGNNIYLTVPYDNVSDRKNAKRMAKIVGDELLKGLKNNRRI
jgi:hypothetical protein